MIQQAPLLFAIAVILVSALGWYVIYKLFRLNIEMKNDLIGSYEKRLAASRQEVQAQWQDRTKIPVIGRTFANESVPLDGYSYSNCTFRNVKFVYKGEAPFDLAHNTIEGDYWIDAATPAVVALIQLLEELKMLKPGLPVNI